MVEQALGADGAAREYIRVMCLRSSLIIVSLQRLASKMSASCIPKGTSGRQIKVRNTAYARELLGTLTCPYNLASMYAQSLTDFIVQSSRLSPFLQSHNLLLRFPFSMRSSFSKQTSVKAGVALTSTLASPLAIICIACLS